MVSAQWMDSLCPVPLCTLLTGVGGRARASQSQPSQKLCETLAARARTLRPNSANIRKNRTARTLHPARRASSRVSVRRCDAGEWSDRIRIKTKEAFRLHDSEFRNAHPRIFGPATSSLLVSDLHVPFSVCLSTLASCGSSSECTPTRATRRHMHHPSVRRGS